MNEKRTYFPRTTSQQRRLLFEVWEETGQRAEACRRAHVAVSTFYRWKPRFALGVMLRWKASRVVLLKRTIKRRRALLPKWSRCGKPTPLGASAGLPTS